MNNYIYEILFLVVLAATALKQSYMIELNKKINHFWWAFLSGGIISLMFIASQYNWLLVVALVLERFVFFSPFLNLIRGKSFFYLNPNGPNASKIDKLIYKAYEPLWVSCLIVFIVLQFYL